MIDDPLSDSLDRVEDAVENASDDIPACVLDTLVEILRNPLECLIYDPGNKLRKAAQGRADGFGNAARKPAEVQLLGLLDQLRPKSFPVDVFNGFGNEFQRSGEGVEDRLPDGRPVQIGEELIDSAAQLGPGRRKVEVLNGSLYDRQRRVKVFSQRRADFFPVNACEQV